MMAKYALRLGLDTWETYGTSTLRGIVLEVLEEVQ